MGVDSLLSEIHILIWDSNKGIYIEIWLKEQDLEKRYDTLYHHFIIWNILKQVCIFSSQLQQKKRVKKDMYIEHFIMLMYRLYINMSVNNTCACAGYHLVK